ncbi:MAG TPA: class I SAM-dependent methyltransferase [Gaiellaceae bacterium]|nr:class I SAM-dependent methyltransferase [Gaiellaceae bacterium]
MPAPFHPDLSETSAPSAAVVTPILLELVDPKSVLDVGCGTGSWLRSFPHDVEVLGLDELPEDQVGGNYRRVSLAEDFDVGRHDLALCLEVAEHLPPASAERLVASLTRAAPVIAFSAAIPGQDGFGHVNCQWPDYWRELFAAHGYQQYDVIRSRIWNDDRVVWWYAQNMFLYSATRSFEGDSIPERVVHPDCWEGSLLASKSVSPNLSWLLRSLPDAIKRALRRRLP